MNNPEAVAIESLSVYQCCKQIVTLIKALLMIGAAVNYGKCACDPSEGTWDFTVVIQMDISSIQLQYSACVCMFISHVIENNLHKQQCIVGLVRTCKYNALYKILYIYIVCLQALMKVGYAHTI